MLQYACAISSQNVNVPDEIIHLNPVFRNPQTLLDTFMYIIMGKIDLCKKKNICFVPKKKGASVCCTCTDVARKKLCYEKIIFVTIQLYFPPILKRYSLPQFVESPCIKFRSYDSIPSDWMEAVHVFGWGWFFLAPVFPLLTHWTGIEIFLFECSWKRKCKWISADFFELCEW